MPRKITTEYSSEELTRLYVTEEKTLDEMCKILGVSRNTASRILREAGVNTEVKDRVFEKAKHGMSTEEFRNFLSVEYLQKGKSCSELAEELGVCQCTISNYLRRFNIHTRKRTEMTKNKLKSLVTIKDKIGKNDVEFKQYLFDEYEKGRSMSSIAKELGISPSGLRKYFLKYSIDRRERTAFFKNNYETNPNWKGGRRFCKNGYIEIYFPNHPNANKRKCIYEHQLVMENYIGRYIEKGEVIHHIDGNKQNNNISNLLLLTNSEHIRLHAILESAHKRMSGKRKEMI